MISRVKTFKRFTSNSFPPKKDDNNLLIAWFLTTYIINRDRK